MSGSTKSKSAEKAVPVKVRCPWIVLSKEQRGSRTFKGGEYCESIENPRGIKGPVKLADMGAVTIQQYCHSASCWSCPYFFINRSSNHLD